MAKKSLERVLQHVRMVAAVHAYGRLDDCELLNRFVGTNDEAAFTVLMERHCPMVLGVCRRALCNLHDAEDGHTMASLEKVMQVFFQLLMREPHHEELFTRVEVRSVRQAKAEHASRARSGAKDRWIRSRSAGTR